jgi:hypothetical protein
MYEKIMRGVAGIGSSPLAAHQAANWAQCRPYCVTVLSSRAEAASRTAVAPPVHAPTLSISHSKCEPRAARMLKACRARGRPSPATRAGAEGRRLLSAAVRPAAV